MKSYNEAKEYALKLFENDLWIFKDNADDFHVIRGYAYYHYAHINQWKPIAQVILTAQVIKF